MVPTQILAGTSMRSVSVVVHRACVVYPQVPWWTKKLWSTFVLFHRSLCLELIAVFKRSLKTFLLQHIAPSTLETIAFYCFMSYVSALTYYLLLLRMTRSVDILSDQHQVLWSHRASLAVTMTGRFVATLVDAGMRTVGYSVDF